MNISYCITVYNEFIELQKLLETLKHSIDRSTDELVVVHTYRDNTEKHSPWFMNIQKLCSSRIMTYKNFHFQNKFCDLKNYLNSLATKDYIFNFDADELATPDAITSWKNYINDEHDLYYVPRVNTVSDYTQEDIDLYGWKINEYGWINWPDYQPRIFKNNDSIKWEGNVHEQITGYKSAVAIPPNPQMALIHQKTIERQRKQNSYYENIIRN